MKHFIVIASLLFAADQTFGQEAPQHVGKTNKTPEKTPVTINAETNHQKPVTKAKFTPEDKAIMQLNTKDVPADFPRYNAEKMSTSEYEGKVAEWFKKNPEKRKVNN
jgi:hypothetical protein